MILALISCVEQNKILVLCTRILLHVGGGFLKFFTLATTKIRNGHGPVFSINFFSFFCIIPVLHTFVGFLEFNLLL